MVKNDKPKISVVIPVYKVGKYIENSIKSVCYQTFSDYEVILVDNNSPDDSIEIAERLLKNEDINYRVIKQTIQGLPAARNKGIEEARGEWIISIDPDDTISKYFLKELYTCAVSNHVDYVFSKYQSAKSDTLFEFKEEKEKGRIIIYDQKDILMDLLTRRNPLMVSNMFFRKASFVENNFKFDEKVILGADLILLWLILYSQEKVAFINKPLYNHFTRPDSLMTAPSWEKLKTNREGYQRMCEIVSNKYSRAMSELILSRSLYAELCVLSIYGKYSFFRKFYNEYYSGKTHKVLQQFPDRKVRLTDLLLYYSPGAFFIINKVFRNPKYKLSRLTSKFSKRI